MASIHKTITETIPLNVQHL